MSKPFSDLNLSDTTISQNYTWQQIKNTQEYVDEKVYVDTVRDVLVVANEDNNIDQTMGLDRLTIFGTSIGATGAQNTVCVGHNMEMDNVNGAVIIGGDRNGIPDRIQNSSNVIVIGHNLDVGLTGTVQQATIIGHDSVLQSGSNTVIIGNNNDQINGGNIVIGHDVVPNELGNTGSIIITTGQLIEEPVSGSIVFGGNTNHTGSTGACIQFLSKELEPVAGGFQIPLVGGESDYDGGLKINYQGNEIVIPFFSV